MRAWLATVAVALAALAALPDSARAQGALVSGSVAAALANSDTSPAFSGGVTWRFNRALGIGVELSHVRGISPDVPYAFCCGDRGVESRLTVFTTNVRVEIPTLSKRVIPFVIGGGGMSAGTTRYPVVYAQMGFPSDVLPALPIMPGPPSVESSGSDMALTLGGGASFLVTNHLAVDVDLRVLHVIGQTSGNIGRFGGGVSFRF